MKRQRSRAYPVLDLGAAHAILRNRLVGLGTAPVDRNDLADILGYSSAGGGVAARKIGAFVQYGFLDRQAGRFRLSLLGHRLQGLRAGTGAFRKAVQSALEKPALFRRILDRYWPLGGIPEDLARVLTEDFGITSRASEEAAKVFIRSAWFAEILDQEGRFREVAGQANHKPVAPPRESGQRMQFPLTNGKEASLQFPDGMKVEDLRRLEARLVFEIKEGSLWEFLGLRRPSKTQKKSADGSIESDNVVSFSSHPKNEVS